MTVTWHVPSATAIAKPAFTGEPRLHLDVRWLAGPDEVPGPAQLATAGRPGRPASTAGRSRAARRPGPRPTRWPSPTSRRTPGTSASTTATPGRRTARPATFTYDAYRRGDEPFYTRVPFDLGGGWSLDVGVHSGEARLARSPVLHRRHRPAGRPRAHLQLQRRRGRGRLRHRLEQQPHAAPRGHGQTSRSGPGPTAAGSPSPSRAAPGPPSPGTPRRSTLRPR